MHKSVLLLLLVAGLAGCLGGGSESIPLSGTAVTADRLEVGSAYQFTHTGGTLAVAMAGDGHAVLTLFDPEDIRMGQLELGQDMFRQLITIEDARPGDYVLHVDELNGTLDLRSRDVPIQAFETLGRHFERIVLVGRPIESSPVTGIFGPIPSIGNNQPVNEQLDFTLLRAPSNLRLLAVGQGSDLMVRVTGGGGTVFQSETFSYYTGGGFSEYRIGPLGGQFDARNVRDAAYSAQVTATNFEGYLILEAWSHSRLVQATPQAAYASHDDVRFVYDELPDRPVLVQVHDRAQALFAWVPGPEEDEEVCDEAAEASEPGQSGQPANGTADGCPGLEEGAEPKEPSWVSVYDPDDRKLGTFPILPGEVIRIPVERGGAYVAVAKLGTIWLGSDRAPTDFQVRILDVVQTTVPSEAAGSSSQYAVREGNGTAEGVLFGVRPAMGESAANGGLADLLDAPESMLAGCSDEGTIRLLQGGDTLGFWGSGVSSSLLAADLFIEPGEVRFVQDGMGGTCGHSALNLFGYLR